MTHEKFSQEELKIMGTYPEYPNQMAKDMGIPTVPEPKYNWIVTPKENFKLFAEGKTPYWMPFTGMMGGDFIMFRPRIHPDNVATHLVYDGEDYYHYETNSMKSSWYDLVWDFIPAAGGATVHPGNPKITDMSEWEKVITLPDLDDMDWEHCIEKNQEYCKSDKVVQLCILSGFWERLMSLMDVENAAIAMIDEDQTEGVKRFLDKHTDLLIAYVDRMLKEFPIDNVLVHDDWGHQNGPFFSLDTCREMLVPYLKRLIDFCHSKGVSFELHCCGKNEDLVPAMIEAGVDLWCGQDINDFDMLAEKYKDAPIGFGIPVPGISFDSDEETIKKAAKEFVIKHKDHHVGVCMIGMPPSVIPYIYEYSRKLYAGEEL